MRRSFLCRGPGAWRATASCVPSTCACVSSTFTYNAFFSLKSQTCLSMCRLQHAAGTTVARCPQQRHYATSPAGPKDEKDANFSQGEQQQESNVREEGLESIRINANNSNAHHAPSLREVLPPTEVELPEESFLKCIDKEIMDETYRLDKDEGAPPIPAGWTLHHTEGSSFIYGRRLWMPPPAASTSITVVAASGVGDDAARNAEGNQSATSTSSDSEDHSSPSRKSTPVPRCMERHLLRIQLTTRDASLDPECDVRGEHFPFSFFVQHLPADEAASSSSARGGGGGDEEFEEHTFYHDSIEARCDVIDGELVVDNVVYHGTPGTTSATDGATAGEVKPNYANPFGGYPGPSLDETEEEVLDGIQSWLAERGVDDQLGEFVGQYAIWIEQAEYERWLQQLRDYVAA